MSSPLLPAPGGVLVQFLSGADLTHTCGSAFTLPPGSPSCPSHSMCPVNLLHLVPQPLPSDESHHQTRLRLGTVLGCAQSLAGQGQSRNEEDGDVGLVNSQRLRPHQASLPLKRARYACLMFEDMSVATAWRFGAGCMYVCVCKCVRVLSLGADSSTPGGTFVF